MIFVDQHCHFSPIPLCRSSRHPYRSDGTIPGSVEVFLVSWTAPFTLEGIHTSYILIINNIDSVEGAQVISLNTTTYVFRTEGPSCDIYQFRVRASNAAGISNTTEPLNATVPACT